MLVFSATGMFFEMKPAKNPNYVFIILLEETLTPEGTGIRVQKLSLLVENTEENRQRLHMLRKGDVLDVEGIGVRKRGKDEYAWIAKQVNTINVFLTMDFDMNDLERKCNEFLKQVCYGNENNRSR